MGYKTKFGVDGLIEMHKGQIVAKGFSQKEDVDYIETFSLIARMESIQMILYIVASLK